jgi:asparagine synthase (glutamine-hydrolysing)
MCGFVGRINVGGPVDRDLLSRQAMSLRHRGPDAMGEWCSSDARAGVAHTRLSILDLSPAGTQPMVNATGTARIVYNGEIYNFAELRHRLAGLGHRFNSATDTEVILAAYDQWGSECVKHLQGMFAFAIYDERQQRLFCARDRVGEKPFFYRHDADHFAFASELKALLQDSSYERVIEPEALDAYFAFGFVPGDLCMLRGFHKLAAAHTLILDITSGAVRIERYWTLPAAVSEFAREEDLLEELDHLLAEAVRSQLVADVPVGILLSGGIDSSLIVAAAVAGDRAVRTFTANFPGNSAFDEGPAARAVAAHFGTLHTDVHIDDPAPEILDLLARHFDEPIADSSMIPTYLIAKAIREHATVALGGEGGDELFGGYPHYRWLQLQARVVGVLPHPALDALSSIGCRLPIGARGRNHLIGTAGTLAQRIAHTNLYFDAGTRAQLLAPAAIRPNAERIKERLSEGNNPSRAAARVDFLTYLTDDVLVKTDRASMAASLELRAPFLDVRMIEFAFRSVPERLKVGRAGTKILLRKLARTKLPLHTARKRKQGFSVPMSDWMKGSWGASIREVVNAAPTSLYDPAVLRRLQASQARGHANTNRIFAVTMFELWRRAYGVDPQIGYAPLT